MPRVRQTDEEKLTTLKIKLEKAKKLKEQYTKQESALKAEVNALEEKARLKAMTEIVSDPEKLKSIFELGIISEEQYKALSDPSTAKKAEVKAEQLSE